MNPQQRAAVAHRGSPVLVLAGAGTGKTRVITHRVAALLDEGVPAWRILAVTFTNKAAAEMRARIEALCEGRHDLRELWVGTFHAICARILRRHGEALGLSSRFTIYDPGDQAAVMRRVLEEQNVSERLVTPRGMLGFIDRAKNLGLGPDRLQEIGLQDPMATTVRNAYQAYQARLLAADAVDFGDLLMHTVALLRKPAAGGQLGDYDPVARLQTRFMHVLVDEFQDTNPVQAELVELLSGRAELCVVGDDDQAIYGWRGADVQQILNFPQRHPDCRVVRLEQNYRSTNHILRCADAVITKNARRLGKTLWSDLGDGEPVRVLAFADEREEARMIAQEIMLSIEEGADPEDYAIFYRTHAQSRVIEDELRKAALSCRIVGGVAFYERAEVKDMLSYLAVLNNPDSDAHLSRILNRPTRGIGTTSQRKLAEYAAKEGISLWKALQRPEAAGVGKAACGKIEAFVTLIDDLREDMGSCQVDSLLARVVEKTGYREMLAADDSYEAEARLENLQELLGNAMEFVQEQPDATLDAYLERVSLVGSERSEGDAGRAVTLMTVHSAKGLEFEYVYLTGMEERVFPHARVLDHPDQLEEERRLAYVALTRAKQQLTVTSCGRRRIFGQVQPGVPSRFVRDLPASSTVQLGWAAPAARVPARNRPLAATRRREREWQDDVEYDREYAQVAPDDLDVVEDVGEGTALYVGMVVRHPQWGDAEVLGWTGIGAKMKLHVRLSSGQTKTVMASFVQPLG